MFVRTTLALLAVTAAGCGGQPARLPVAQVTGKVLYRGQPATGAQVILVPVADDSPDGIKPRGVVKPDGTFDLSTYGGEKGVPAGEYRVSVRWPASAGQPAAGDDPEEAGPPGPPGGPQADLLRERYSNPKTSGLTLTVPAGGGELKPIELQ